MRAVLGAAVLAGLAGAVASVFFEPRIAYHLAGTELGQRVLGAVLAARAPAPPTGLNIAERGGIVPALQLTTLGGGKALLSQVIAGKPTVINVWASWCGPCLKEMPDLQAFATQQGAEGVQVAGIALDEPAAAQTLLARLRISYPNWVDTPGPADASVRLGNPAGVLPYSVLIDSDGRLLKTRIGPFASAADIAGWAR
jgi:thiol-disulfide isomerase/thioredoxin